MVLTPLICRGRWCGVRVFAKFHMKVSERQGWTSRGCLVLCRGTRDRGDAEYCAEEPEAPVSCGEFPFGNAVVVVRVCLLRVCP